MSFVDGVEVVLFDDSFNMFLADVKMLRQVVNVETKALSTVVSEDSMNFPTP